MSKEVSTILAKAKKTVKTVNESTEKIDSKKDTYKLLPGMSKYEFNGIILRNSKTKNILSFKTGRTKYQLFDDNGKSHNLNKEEIKALFPVEKEKPVKEKKEKTEKAKPEKKTFSSDLVKDMTRKQIVDQDCKNNRKHFMLHLKGCDVNEIHELTKAPIPSIKRDIWRFETGVTTY